MKGWRTLAFNAAVALAGVIVAFNWGDVLPAKYAIPGHQRRHPDDQRLAAHYHRHAGRQGRLIDALVVTSGSTCA
jgi:hypothetical protein